MNKMSTKKLVLAAILTALVIILQLIGQFIRFGTVSISLVLLPIVIGAATCGVGVGAWLGFVFGAVVLCQADTQFFYAMSIPGTIITVLVKGTMCGLAAGYVYKLIEKKNRYAAVIAAAITCPVVNTGIFLIGSVIFFMDWVTAEAAGRNLLIYMIISLVGINFLAELISNIVLSPIVLRLLNINDKAQ